LRVDFRRALILAGSLALAACATPAPVPTEISAPAPSIAPVPATPTLKRKVAIGRFSNSTNYGRALLLATATKVGFTYELRSCKTNAVLWQDKRTVVYSPQPNSSGNIFADLIVMAIVAAVEKAAPNYIPLAKQANLLASTTAGQGLPAGPYLADQYQKDGTTFPSTPTAAK